MASADQPHLFGHAEAVFEEGLGMEVEDNVEEDGHDEEAGEDEGEDAEEFAEQVVEAGDGLGEDGIEGAVLLVLGDDEGGGDDGDDDREVTHCANHWIFQAEQFVGTGAFGAHGVGEFDEVHADGDEDEDEEEVEDLHAHELREGAPREDERPGGREEGGSGAWFTHRWRNRRRGFREGRGVRGWCGVCQCGRVRPRRGSRLVF